MINENKYELIGCIIDKEHLLGLLVLCEDFFGKVDFSIRLTDGSSYKELSSNDFLKLDLSNRTILYVHVYCYTSDYKTDYKSGFTLDYSFSGSSYSISIYSSDYDKYSFLKTKIDEWIVCVFDKNRQKIINVGKHNAVISVLTTVILASFTVLGSTFIFNIPEQYAYLWIIIGSVFGALWFFVASIIYDKIFDLFPNTEIDIGLNTYKNRRRKTYALLTIFVIPLVYTLIGFILSLISK